MDIKFKRRLDVSVVVVAAVVVVVVVADFDF